MVFLLPLKWTVKAIRIDISCVLHMYTTGNAFRLTPTNSWIGQPWHTLAQRSAACFMYLSESSGDSLLLTKPRTIERKKGSRITVGPKIRTRVSSNWSASSTSTNEDSRK